MEWNDFWNGKFPAKVCIDLSRGWMTICWSDIKWILTWVCVCVGGGVT